ncbi:MAG: S8 family serine peptidase [Verrucomicrobiota bacterium]
MRLRFHPTFPSALALLLSACILLEAGSAFAIDFSVPYLLNGLPVSGTGAVQGFGAVVGQIEVRNDEGNGIDGFAGHTHAAFAPGTGFLQTGPDSYTLVNFGYQDVKDFSGGNSATGNPADSNFHGTFVAGIMANNASVSVSGTAYPFSGVAPGAAYYGAVFSGADTKAGFLTLNQSLHYLTIVAGAQTINNSWGSTVTDASQLDGNGATALLMDEYAGYHGKTGGTTGQYLDKLMVISAGNSGEGNGLPGSPADSYNGLSVGALDATNPNANALVDAGRAPFARIASYSSYKPLANGRNGVDLVAPGTNLWSDLAINVAQNDFGIPGNSAIAGVASGTSFAAPHVTGEAALLYGAATFPLTSGTTNKGTALSTDHKLIKAILINSADKIPGLDANGNAQSSWQPGLVVTGSDGTPTALAPLNYAVGSGKADANRAFQEYSESGNSFWDLNALSTEGSGRFYTFGTGKFISLSSNQPFLFSLTATLVWDRHVDLTVSTDLNDPSVGSVTKDLLSDLDLILQEEISPGVWSNIFISAGTLGNIDQIYMPELSGTANYRLEVLATTLADPATGGEDYALAVDFQTVPEPGTGLLTVEVFLLFVTLRRKR